MFCLAVRRSADFDFARYACLVTDRIILALANPPLRSWTVLIVLHWVGYLVVVALGLERCREYNSYEMKGGVLVERVSLPSSWHLSSFPWC